MRISPHCKQHRLYTTVFNESNVLTLRTAMRYMKVRNWYNMRKPEMVSVIVANVCANIITRLFRIKKFTEESWCPISLIPVSELKDPFVHDGITFSKYSLVEYIRHSYDFSNPITRKDITREDTIRLNSPSINMIFEDRESLRSKLVEDIYEFSAMEDELEECLDIIIDIKAFRSTGDLSNLIRVQIQFHRIWSRIKTIDIHRTICVMKSLLDKIKEIYRYNERRKRIGVKLLKTYLSASYVCLEDETDNMDV